jgi:hypothetical protein
MSKYHEYQTQFTEGSILVAALGALGLPAEQFQEPQRLQGYEGGFRQQKADIIVRRKHVGGASNEIGFLKGKTGTYQAIISEFDRGQGYNDQWMGKLKQAYAGEKIMTQYRSLGYTEFEREEVQGADGQMTTVIRAAIPATAVASSDIGYGGGR